MGDKKKISLSRRDFISVTAQMAAFMGLSSLGARQMMAAVQKDDRPDVVWLHFQECTGCSESLLRATHPAVGQLILDLISLNYHETLMAAAGHQAEKSLQDAVKKGNYVLVVEGSIPVKDNGVYCQIAGKTALKILQETAPRAAAIIAIGSCASWGGVQSKAPNPTGASPVQAIIKNKPIINLPGCPGHPDIFLSTVLYYLTFKKLPKLDAKGRPLLGYGTKLHDHCERKAHFDAGRFVTRYGDKGHQNGWCLYLMGCKGPVTYASCNALRFNDVGVWPVSQGHPCAGCTEDNQAFEVPIHQPPKIITDQTPDILADQIRAENANRVMDADLLATYPLVNEPKERGLGTLVGAGVAGAVIGAALGFAGAVASKLPDKAKEGQDEQKTE